MDNYTDLVKYLFNIQIHHDYGRKIYLKQTEIYKYRRYNTNIFARW